MRKITTLALLLTVVDGVRMHSRPRDKSLLPMKDYVLGRKMAFLSMRDDEGVLPDSLVTGDLEVS